MSKPWKLQNACHEVAAFAKKLGRDGRVFDLSLLKHILDTRNEALIAAACYLVQHDVEDMSNA